MPPSPTDPRPAQPSPAPAPPVPSPGDLLPGGAGLPITRDYRLALLAIWCGGSAAIYVEYTWTILKADGRLLNNSRAQRITDTGTLHRVVVDLDDGWLIAAGYQLRRDASSTDVARGGIALLAPGEDGYTPMMLADGIAEYHHGETWPFGSQGGRPDGLHEVRVSGADPAAGANPSITRTAYSYGLLLWATATFVTDATVANRRPMLRIKDVSSTDAVLSVVQDPQTASLSTTYWWRPGHTLEIGASVATRTAIVAPGPHWVAPGGTIDISTQQLQAGDNWGALTAGLLEWPVNFYAP